MDFSDLKIGDTDPYLGKKIKEIILSSNSFIVYIDEDQVIQWATSGHSEYGDDFGDIANQISYWESSCNRLFSKDDRYEYKCLLAEGYARMLGEGNQESAQKIIDRTSQRIEKHGKEILRQRYLLSGLYSTAFVAFLLMLAIILRHPLKDALNASGYEILLTSLFGGIGAFISTVTRAKNYNAEISVGKRIHEIDGVLRIIYGVIAGGIIGMGIKSNIIFGFVNEIQKNGVFVMTFLGAIGGASEIAIPSIIKKMDGKI